MTPTNRFLDTHWRSIAQALMDDAGFGLRQALDFVPVAVDELEAAHRADPEQPIEEAVDPAQLAARNGIGLECVRAGLRIVCRALASQGALGQTAAPGRR